jgi:hypothetical protein
MSRSKIACLVKSLIVAALLLPVPGGLAFAGSLKKMVLDATVQIDGANALCTGSIVMSENASALTRSKRKRADVTVKSLIPWALVDIEVPTDEDDAEGIATMILTAKHCLPARKGIGFSILPSSSTMARWRNSPCALHLPRTAASSAWKRIPSSCCPAGRSRRVRMSNCLWRGSAGLRFGSTRRVSGWSG